MQIAIYNHQSAINISRDTLEQLTKLAQKVFPKIVPHQTSESVLGELEEIEISLVDDQTIEQIHIDFMDIEGATDVITFHHGEIIISAETAKTETTARENNLTKEILLYIIHGILHLAGHKDYQPEEKKIMEEIQFALLEQSWR